MEKNTKKRVIAYLHTHWDREWYREKEEFNLRLLEVFDEVLDELNTNSAPCFYFDGQTGALIDYIKFRPGKLPEIKKLISEKKLAVGPFFISADAFLTNFRCMIKNLEEGIKYSKWLGCDNFIGYLPDIFGHSRGVFEAFKLFDIKNSIIWRGTGAIKCDMNVRGINTTRLVEGYFIDILHQNLPDFELAIQIENLLDNIAEYSGNTLLLPIGADHLAILKNSSEKIENINKHLKKYEIELTMPHKYFESVDFKNTHKYDGEFLDNSVNNILGGVYSSRIYQKTNNAKIMHKISRIIEPLNAFLDLKYQPNIDWAYTELLKNHAHDSIYGCSTDKAHRAVDMRFERVEEILNGMEKRIIRDFDKSTLKPSRVAVFNLSNYKSNGIYKITSEHKLPHSQIIKKTKYFCDKKLYDTRQIPATEDIVTLYEQLIECDTQDALTFSVLDIKNSKKETCVTNNYIENPFIKLVLDGSKINIVDKKTGREYSDFIKITNTKDAGDSYNYSPASHPNEIKPYKSKIIESGTIRSILRIYYKNFELDVILNNKTNYIEFLANINNKEKNHKLQAVFNLDNPIFETFASDSLGIVKRNCDPFYSLYDNQPAIRPHELKTNSYPMLNFVFAQGVGVLGEGVHEYEIYKNELRIALLRCTGIISNPKNPARSIPAGPPVKTPELQCLGKQNVRFGLCFCSDKKELFRFSEEFLGTNLAFLTGMEKQTKTFCKTSADCLFYGISSKNQAILYNMTSESISFNSLANNEKFI